jgi:molybdopterin synthase sulfur carrier subunit
MATVWIPPLLRDLTGGETRMDIPAATVRELIAALDARYPGIAGRLVEDGKMRPGIAVIVDNTVCPAKLRQKLTETSEVHFLPAISGG